MSLVFVDFSQIWTTDSDRRLIYNLTFSSSVEHGDLIIIFFITKTRQNWWQLTQWNCFVFPVVF